MAKWLLTCLLIVISFVSGATGNFPPETAENNIGKSDVEGGVLDYESKKPLGNVTVTVFANNKKEKSAFTDLQGNFSFEDLKPGTYKFVFEKEGYKKVTKEKTIIRADEALQLNVNMQEHNSFDFMPGPSSLIDFDD